MAISPDGLVVEYGRADETLEKYQRQSFTQRPSRLAAYNNANRSRININNLCITRGLFQPTKRTPVSKRGDVTSGLIGIIGCHHQIIHTKLKSPNIFHDCIEFLVQLLGLLEECGDTRESTNCVLYIGNVGASGIAPLTRYCGREYIVCRVMRSGRYDVARNGVKREGTCSAYLWRCRQIHLPLKGEASVNFGWHGETSKYNATKFTDKIVAWIKTQEFGINIEYRRGTLRNKLCNMELKPHSHVTTVLSVVDKDYFRLVMLFCCLRNASVTSFRNVYKVKPAQCFIWYDIRDIAVHVHKGNYTQGFGKLFDRPRSALLLSGLKSKPDHISHKTAHKLTRTDCLVCFARQPSSMYAEARKRSAAGQTSESQQFLISSATDFEEIRFDNGVRRKSCDIYSLVIERLRYFSKLNEIVVLFNFSDITCSAGIITDAVIEPYSRKGFIPLAFVVLSDLRVRVPASVAYKKSDNCDKFSRDKLRQCCLPKKTRFRQFRVYCYDVKTHKNIVWFEGEATGFANKTFKFPMNVLHKSASSSIWYDIQHFAVCSSGLTTHWVAELASTAHERISLLGAHQDSKVFPEISWPEKSGIAVIGSTTADINGAFQAPGYTLEIGQSADSEAYSSEWKTGFLDGAIRVDEHTPPAVPGLTCFS
ncbi:hypothetical protein CLF_106410, partial [Clonorchis sinensis]